MTLNEKRDHSVMNRKSIGRILIIVGVSVWVPYFVLKLSGVSVEMAPFLLVHLMFVIPGAILAPGETLYSKLMGWYGKPKSEDHRNT